MNKATLLLVSTNKALLNEWLTTLHPQYHCMVAEHEDEAIYAFLQSSVNAVLLDDDLDSMVKARLQKLFTAQQSDTVFIHTARGNKKMMGMVADAIKTQQKKNKPAISFSDDALRHAGINITIN